ncbi:MAG TPA: Hpt domain-containing protein [Candidatus Binatia bacterium]|jgi:HPt (histidine-containing phosphotransfer) domain-containing protein|nr:Hpt domain-containing protein [Candidatus Binatia bacterium]
MSDQEPVLDHETLMDQVGGDPELLLRLIELFDADRTETIDAIQAGLAARDAKTVERAAHRLKGSLGTLAATAAHHAAMNLELVGRAGDLVQAESAWKTLEHELIRLKPELERIAAEG